MIRTKIVKWVAAGALALAAVPAIGLAVGAKHVPTTAAPAKLVQPAKPAVASKAATARHTSHVKPSTKHVTHKKATTTTHSKHAKTSSHSKHKQAHKSVHHRTTHHAATKATAKKHSPLS